MEYIQIILLLATLLAVLLKKQSNTKTTNFNRGKNKMILDTCALIDGRIVELAKLGFTPGELIVPKFVITELQMLADGRDAHKRERARFGLDVVKELQDCKYTSVTIDIDDKSDMPTDDKLVKLAENISASLYTTDFNLNKVAEIRGVNVLNINQLAQQLRPNALPGESLKVKILQKGSSPSQGVGYLDDGTMVVVDGAVRSIGKQVDVIVTRVHQSVSGKMMFATLSGDESMANKHRPARRTTNRTRKN